MALPPGAWVGVTFRTVGNLLAAPLLKKAPLTLALADPFICSLGVAGSVSPPFFQKGILVGHLGRILLGNLGSSELRVATAVLGLEDRVPQQVFSAL